MNNNELDLTYIISTPDDKTPQPAEVENTSASTEELWNYHNMVQAVEPDHKKRTGTNQTPAKKLERKKRKARKVQRASRKLNRK
jgi:hypothetical protein